MNPASPDVLIAAAGEAGLDGRAAGDLLGRGALADEVHGIVRRWQRLGIDSVPATVIDGRHLIQGAQSAEVYEQALRRFAVPPAHST